MSSTVGGLNVYATQKNLFDYATAQIPWEVVDAEIPDAETVRLVNGVLKPYVVMRFSDMLKAGGQTSFGGPRWDGYYSLVQMICVATTGLKAQELQSLVNEKMIGYTPDANAGPLEKDFGGGSMNIKAKGSVPGFFVSIAAFRFLTNLQPQGN